MKILIFDTETSGVKADANDILQLSYQIIDGDTFQTLREVDRFFPWPEDKSRVSPQAITVNGLTEEYLATKTLSDRSEAIEELKNELVGCQYCVAHNGRFDIRFLDTTAMRVGLPAIKWPHLIDTMTTTVSLCRIAKGYGYKWPKLSELAEHLSINMDDLRLHDSSADVELTKRCFVKLVKADFYKL